MPVSADVGDNLNGWLINFLGYGKEGSTPNDYGGSLVERVNYLEKQQQAICSKTDSLATKEQIKNLATKEDVENVSKAANASYNLFVYIPKNIATGNYNGQKVTITSTSGNQNSTATLSDDGTNYSATLYFNFSGNCRLDFNVLSKTTTFGITLPVTINATGQEQILWQRDSFSDKYSLDFVHQICSNNQAELFFSPGNKLENGWSIVNTESNGIKIWYRQWFTTYQNPTHWQSALRQEGLYCDKWNNNNAGLPIMAYKSELLSYDEAAAMTESDRSAYFNDYWLSTKVNEYHCAYIVNYLGHIDSGFTLEGANVEDFSQCCPAVWIH